MQTMQAKTLLFDQTLKLLSVLFGGKLDELLVVIIDYSYHLD